MPAVKILFNLSNLLFVAAVILGLYLPQASSVAYILILPALMVTLTVTLLRFPGGFFKNPRDLLAGALWGNLMSYLFFGNLIILGGMFLVRDEQFWIGLVLIAAIPPAVAVLPLGERLKTDKMLTLAGFAGTYIGALILSPLIGIAFLKFIPIHYSKLIILVVTLVMMPLILSRIAVDRNWDDRIERREGIIADVCFFIVFYALASHNAGVIQQRLQEIILIAVIALAAITIVSLTLFVIGRFYRVSREMISFLMLLGTMKNYGLAGGIALYIFGSETALPALIFSACMFIHAIWLGGWELLRSSKA